MDLVNDLNDFLISLGECLIENLGYIPSLNTSRLISFTDNANNTGNQTIQCCIIQAIAMKMLHDAGLNINLREDYIHDL